MFEDQVGPGELSVRELNIQGLCSSIHESKFLLCESHSSPKVIGLCETFLRDINDSLFDIPCYTIERLNRSKMSKGGLAFYMSNGGTYSFVRIFLLILKEYLSPFVLNY